MVNRYVQATHYESEQNLDFWLASEPESRIYAVTKLVSEGMDIETKVEKRMVQKVKMKE